jgi:hypothetical protein
MRDLRTASAVPTTGEVYRRLDSLVRTVETWPQLRFASVRGCEDRAVAARLVQRIVEVVSDDVTRLALLGSDPFDQPELEAGGLRLMRFRRRAVPTLRLFIQCVLQFAAGWGRVTLQLLQVLARRGRGTGPATLLIGATGYENDDTRFARFCRSGPVAPLARAQHLIVQSAQPPGRRSDETISYRMDLLPAVAERMPWPSRLRTFVAHLATPLHLARALVRSPIYVLLAHDFARLPMARHLDRIGALEAIAVTNSAFPAQPLWMHGIQRRQFRLHMIWYSQNFLPKVYVGESEQSDLPAARHIRVDEHWVWTEGFAAYLRGIGQHSTIHAVGPLLWYLPKPRPGADVRAGIRVAVFDITPFAPGTNSAFNAAQNYYSAERMVRFISDTVAACGDVARAMNTTVEVLIKHKRSVTASHDRTYIQFVKDLTRGRPEVVLLPHPTDLYALLADCDASVSVPYTSTAYVAAHLGRPALYYDPFADLVPRHEPNEHVELCAGPDQLRAGLARAIASRGAAAAAAQT